MISKMAILGSKISKTVMKLAVVVYMGHGNYQSKSFQNWTSHLRVVTLTVLRLSREREVKKLI